MQYHWTPQPSKLDVHGNRSWARIGGISKDARGALAGVVRPFYGFCEEGQEKKGDKSRSGRAAKVTASNERASTQSARIGLRTANEVTQFKS